MPEPIATVEFSDGHKRPIFMDGDRQYVLDNDGNAVYGVWYMERDECDTPVVVGDALPADF